METELLGVGIWGSLADAGNRLETIKEAIQASGPGRKFAENAILGKIPRSGWLGPFPCPKESYSNTRQE
jgi:hypothetical protein